MLIKKMENECGQGKSRERERERGKIQASVCPGFRQFDGMVIAVLESPRFRKRVPLQSSPQVEFSGCRSTFRYMSANMRPWENSVKWTWNTNNSCLGVWPVSIAFLGFWAGNSWKWLCCSALIYGHFPWEPMRCGAMLDIMQNLNGTSDCQVWTDEPIP